ncbi:hypothetical protein EVAR_62781_1 [Eumeta japonica]|uniref:Uncharacterized protein n=1 Tax=Eumeta variegata TaxID=151549 RepID=A0A4C1Z3X5_EUMVA|nr:hypothetical protein EVAR_62781_1 [Eumeta japonica]
MRCSCSAANELARKHHLPPALLAPPFCRPLSDGLVLLTNSFLHEKITPKVLMSSSLTLLDVAEVKDHQIFRSYYASLSQYAV